MEPSPRTHVYRLVILLVVLGAVFAYIRHLAVPDSWDHTKGYRLNAISELKLLEAHYGGRDSCGEAACHGQEQPSSHASQIEALAGGSHSRLACEGCHGPISNHIANGVTQKRPPPADPVGLCLTCHKPLLGRTAVPVFDPENPLHESEQPDQYPSCPDCHDPHDPKIEL